MADLTLKQQKIIRIGNSLGITLDGDFVRHHGLKAGEPVVIRYHKNAPVMAMSTPTGIKRAENKDLMVSEAKKAYMATKITPELEEWTENFLKENEEALKILANL